MDQVYGLSLLVLFMDPVYGSSFRVGFTNQDYKSCFIGQIIWSSLRIECIGRV